MSVCCVHYYISVVVLSYEEVQCYARCHSITGLGYVYSLIPRLPSHA